MTMHKPYLKIIFSDGSEIEIALPSRKDFGTMVNLALTEQFKKIGTDSKKIFNEDPDSVFLYLENCMRPMDVTIPYLKALAEKRIHPVDLFDTLGVEKSISENSKKTLLKITDWDETERFHWKKKEPHQWNKDEKIICPLCHQNNWTGACHNKINSIHVCHTCNIEFRITRIKNIDSKTPLKMDTIS